MQILQTSPAMTTLRLVLQAKKSVMDQGYPQQTLLLPVVSLQSAVLRTLVLLQSLEAL
jgi:hypothetical protein